MDCPYNRLLLELVVVVKNALVGVRSGSLYLIFNSFSRVLSIVRLFTRKSSGDEF